MDSHSANRMSATSTPNPRRSNGDQQPSQVLTSTIGGGVGNGPADGSEHAHAALPPPLPAVERGSALNRSTTLNSSTNRRSNPNGSATSPRPPLGNSTSALRGSRAQEAAQDELNEDTVVEGASAQMRASSQAPPSAVRSSQSMRPPLSGASPVAVSRLSRPASAAPATTPRGVTGQSSAYGRPSTSSAVAPAQRASSTGKQRASSVGSRAPSRRSSSRGRFSEEGSSEEVEELMPMSVGRTRPMEKFFVETHEFATNREAEYAGVDAAGQPRNENEVLLEQFAEYTDDGSFFSSGSAVIECDPYRMAFSPVRGRATKSVHETLQLRAMTGGRVPEDAAWNSAQKESWIYQIHHRALALQYSSLYIFPARWTPRVVVYNVMHHWLFEVILCFIIIGYSIFQASWGRYTAAKGHMHRPDFELWADVFYVFLYGVEIVFRIFASGFLFHPRSFLRSPWHWLDTAVLVMLILECTWWQQVWNFTAWRLIRCIKCLTYVQTPVRMKLLAKSLLRSTNKIFQSSIILLYFVFFFALMGLQLFESELHSRCVNDLTGEVTNQICRSVSTGKYWFYWGHHCSQLYTCVVDKFPNPHFGFRSFDDIGHAMLSTFQIMTFQGWTSLMNETSDGLAVMAFLYYWATILICTWMVPSLFVGVFIEKIERTSRLFVLKQLNLFDDMLQEQKQRMNAMVRLQDYVQRDDDGRITHYPAYSAKQMTSTDDDSSQGREESKHIARRTATVSSTRWNDEQRLQLQLSLTRQRHVAVDGERKRLPRSSSLRTLLGMKSEEEQAREESGQLSRRASTRSASVPNQRIHGPENFALGGRVGAVQHHPSATAIGASRQSELPFAVRQEIETDQLRFLDPYASVSALPPHDGIENPSADLRASTHGPLGASALRSSRGGSMINGMSQQSLSRPPLGSTILAARESVGVVPNQRSMSVVGSMARINSMSHVDGSARTIGGATALHASAVEQPPMEPCVVNDPEGGDFRYANTCVDKINIIRNIIHMFTEGYPRILSQYLWEYRLMQWRYGLMPLNYSNRYEEQALAQLRKRRAKERRAEREEMRLHGVAPMVDEDDEQDYDNVADEDVRETRWMREEGLVSGSLSPIRMAQNIKENAPVTPFQAIMYLFMVFNAVFNASRYDTMPDHWEMGVFVSGVCFSALFTLELLLRFSAMGPGPFLFDIFNLIEATFVIISLFQLGFSRANTTSLFNWVRLLKLCRVMPCTPLRRVTRVLIHSIPDIAYALVFFSLYMFMWLLIGMSFFGSRFGWVNYANSDYYTRGNFETFSQAAYAVAQAFSVNRDQWLYMSWTGMRVRGSYTVMYFIATVFVAFVFQFFFIAVMTWAWQTQEEREEYAASSLIAEATRHRNSTARLPWFDFTVWRSFKHIHGGFERRDVAPDEVYFLNEDMRRQLRLIETQDRNYKEAYERALRMQRDLDEEDYDNYDYLNARNGNEEEIVGPQYVNIGGQLYRQQSMPHAHTGHVITQNPQQRFAREFHAVPATGYAAGARNVDDSYSPREESHTPPPPLSASRAFSEQSRSIVNPLVSDHRRSLRRSTATAPSSIRGGNPVASEGNPSVAAQLLRLGRARNAAAAGHVREAGAATDTSLVDVQDESGFEHVLLPGPRLRYKSTVENDCRVFERCLDCNAHKQMPLRAAPGVQQRRANDLHAEHCHMAAVRSSQQLVLNALLGYARMQADHRVKPTKRMLETVLGQAWSCGMLLFETIENTSCVDLPEEERDWGRLQQALEMQQWLLGLHTGEEQVGRATLAYVLAHQQKQEEVFHETTYTESWQEYSFFAFSPSNPFRRVITYIVNSWWFEAFILFIIYAASVCLAVYAPGENNRDMGGSYNSGKYKALHVLDDVFSVIFGVELLLKWISMGLFLPVGRAYFWHLWNLFDCFIVVISFVSWGKKDIFLRYLKVMRCFRIIGPLRYWRWNDSMAAIARTLWDSIPTLANVCLLMLLNYIVWAILFVSMFMNKMNFCSNSSIVNLTQCREEGYHWLHHNRNFRNFYESLLTTYELSTGAEWMDVIYQAVDSWSRHMAPRYNRHPYLGLVFIAYYYVSHFIFFSLFIASLIYCYVVVKNAMDGALAAGASFEQQLWIRMQNLVLRIRPKVRLLPLNNPISRGFHVVVSNKYVEMFMGIILMFNMVTMALQWYHMEHRQKTALVVFQYVWIGFFTVEVLMRLFAYGFRFFTRWEYCWDLLCMALSFVWVGCYKSKNHHVPLNLNVLRVLRIGRFFNMVTMLTPVHTHLMVLIEVLRMSVPGIINITFLYMLSVFVFAVLGLHFLGYLAPYGGYIDDKYNNFQTFVNSLIMVVRLGTLENWATMLRGSMDKGRYCDRKSMHCGTTNWAPVYYIAIVICFYLLMTPLYLAVIVDNYVSAVRMYASLRRLHDVRQFCELWSERDPNNTLVLSVSELLDILERLRLPLGLSDRRNRIELMRLLREYNIPDHDGYVYYYEVLMPLARRVMAMSFSEDSAATPDNVNDTDGIWRVSEGNLGAMGPSLSTQETNFRGRTVVERFAVTYIQAAYRRDRATRNYYLMKSELWRAGRAACDAQNVSYANYGFGNVGLAYADPREEGESRGFSLPEGATTSSLPTFVDPVNARIARRLAEERQRRLEAGDNDGEEATLLPAMYRSAIVPVEKKFGPDAPNAIKRHERRKDKLQRRRAAEDVERRAFEEEEDALSAEAANAAMADFVEGDGVGVSRSNMYSTNAGTASVGPSASGVRSSVAGPGASAVAPPSLMRRSVNSLYDMNPNSSSYQPPLGSSPEQLREEEQARRQQQQPPPGAGGVYGADSAEELDTDAYQP